MTPHQTSNPIPDRDISIRILLTWVREGTHPQDQPAWQQASGFSRELIWTCCRHRGLLDGWIDHLSKTPPGKRIRPFLWVGLTQLFLLDGVPEHAAVHETMESAKRLRVASGQQRFINAILRNAIRRKDGLVEWAEFQLPEIRYSHPDFCIERWETVFGEEKTLQMLEWNQQRAHTYARRTKLGKEQNDLIPEDVIPVKDAPEFYQLPRKMNPTDLPGFQEGAWYIQDPATRHAPMLLNAQPGEKILDACAAPGGKTSVLLDAMGRDTTTLWAIDPHKNRTKRLRENMDRLQAHQVQVVTTTLSEMKEDHQESFDGIILDVPCSNTGVLQRRPDAKWNLTPEMFEERATVQRTILEEALPLCAPGGRIVYSTCCIEPEETTELIASFLNDHPEWTRIEEKRILPGEDNTDGAYCCLLKR